MFSKLLTKYNNFKIKIRGKFLDAIYESPMQFVAYKSYWHYRLQGKPKQNTGTAPVGYLAQKPNYRAGIGHQLANWNGGYFFAGYYGLSFAHFPFSQKKWEHFLGFGEQEMPAASLLKNSGYKKVRLPRFNSIVEKDVALIGAIIDSYKNKKVFFQLELDQGFMDQEKTAAQLSEKFFNAPARKENKLFYNTTQLNIAVHIRRGDVSAMKQAGDALYEERWLTNDYFVTVLKQLLALLPANKDTAIYIFSQGSREDFPEFAGFSNVHFCLDVNAYDSFLHMVYADILISSKSSFSYKPALISKGIKICPQNFWYKYPPGQDYILAADDGSFTAAKSLFTNV